MSVPHDAKPYFHSWQDSIGDGNGGKSKRSFILTLRDLVGSAQAVDDTKKLDVSTTLAEKSDHLVVASKPVKAGGAKGVMVRKA